MFPKLDKLYDSKSTLAKIAMVTELVYTHYNTILGSMSVLLDLLPGILYQLKAMGMQIDYSILAAFIDVAELLPVTASILTLSDSKLQWEG